MRAQGNSGAARQFHDALGRLAMSTLSGWRALAAAADHFTRGTDMGTFARLLHGQAEADGGHELFISRAVLQVRRLPPSHGSHGWRLHGNAGCQSMLIRTGALGSPGEAAEVLKILQVLAAVKQQEQEQQKQQLQLARELLAGFRDLGPTEGPLINFSELLLRVRTSSLAQDILLRSLHVLPTRAI